MENRNKHDNMVLCFEDIDNILEFKLPKSAYQYPAWWANQGYGSQAKVWIYAGWRTMDVKLGESVTFQLRK